MNINRKRHHHITCIQRQSETFEISIMCVINYEKTQFKTNFVNNNFQIMRVFYNIGI